MFSFLISLIPFQDNYHYVTEWLYHTSPKNVQQKDSIYHLTLPSLAFNSLLFASSPLPSLSRSDILLFFYLFLFFDFNKITKGTLLIRKEFDWSWCLVGGTGPKKGNLFLLLSSFFSSLLLFFIYFYSPLLLYSLSYTIGFQCPDLLEEHGEMIPLNPPEDFFTCMYIIFI